MTRLGMRPSAWGLAPELKLPTISIVGYGCTGCVIYLFGVAMWLGMIAAVVFVVVKVLQYMGVI